MQTWRQFMEENKRPLAPVSGNEVQLTRDLLITAIATQMKAGNVDINALKDRPSAGKLNYSPANDIPKIARFKAVCKRKKDDLFNSHYPSYDTQNYFKNKVKEVRHDEEMGLKKLVNWIEGPKARMKYEVMQIWCCFYPWHDCIIAEKRHDYLVNTFTRNNKGVLAWKYPWKNLEYEFVNPTWRSLLPKQEIIRLNPSFNDRGYPHQPLITTQTTL